jgi:hypothetical protein
VRFSPIYGIDAKGRAVEYRAKKDDKDEKSSGIGWLEVLIALVVVTKLLGLW